MNVSTKILNIHANVKIMGMDIKRNCVIRMTILLMGHLKMDCYKTKQFIPKTSMGWK
jgi:hypothetical protein